MIRWKDDELLNREIEGENTAEESAALSGRLDREPDLRASHARLVALAQALREVKEEEPPPDLALDVLRSLRDKPRPMARRAGWIDILASTFAAAARPRPILTFASGLAVGALVTAFLVQSIGIHRLDRSELTGTILPPQRLGHLETIDRGRLELEGVRAEVTTKHGKGVVVAEMQIESSRAVDLAVEFDASTFTPLAFERRGGATTDVQLGGDRVSLSHAGAGRYVLVLGVREAVPSRLRLRLNGNGATIEKTLDTRAEKTNLSGR
jgi:hypothetical protein